MKLISLLLSLFLSTIVSAQIKNYMFIGMDREQLQDTGKWATNGLFEGVQIAYSWRQLVSRHVYYDV